MWHIVTDVAEGVCPYCGGENLDYGDINFEGNSLDIEVRCEDCGGIYQELYATLPTGLGVDDMYYPSKIALDEDDDF